MALTTNSIGGWMRLEMGVEGEETMCERFCVCVCEHANAHPRVNVYQDPEAHDVCACICACICACERLSGS